MEQEWAADQDVLRNLAANGDQASIRRSVDVSFRGSEANLERLSEAAEELGLTELGHEDDAEGGHPWLFLERVQAVDEKSIRALTELCLQIEQLFDLEYDGWGCEAQTGTVH
jgi:hypothetical protein